jgi:DNA-binding response OmpR family regulator
MNNPLHAELAAVRAENAMLRAIVAGFSASADMAASNLIAKFKLRKQEARVLAIMTDGRMRSNVQICDASGYPAMGKDQIRVLMHRIKKKIAPHTITSVWGAGYKLEGESLAAMREIARGQG